MAPGRANRRGADALLLRPGLASALKEARATRCPLIVTALIEKHAARFAYQIAEVYALRNDANETFEWLDRASSNRDVGIGYLLYDPSILRYKADPRFAAFCRKVGLPIPGEVRQQT